MSLLCFVKMSRMTIEYWSSMASIETCSWPSWIWMWDSWCPRMMCEGHLSQIGINHYHCNRLLILTLARILIMGSSDQYHCHCGFHYHMFWFPHHHRHDNDTTIFDYVFFFLKLVHFRYYINLLTSTLHIRHFFILYNVFYSLAPCFLWDTDHDVEINCNRKLGAIF